MLSTIANVAKSAQICPKMISLRNFEIPPKIEILVFFEGKNKPMCRGGTKAYVHHFHFQYNNLSYAFFIV
jgi:hypothetical protein